MMRVQRRPTLAALGCAPCRRRRPVLGGAPPWTAADYRALAQAAAQVGAKPADLLLVLFAESRLDPSAVFVDAKGFPLAIGLNQITPANAAAMGITEEQRRALRTMTVQEQLPYVVRSLRAATTRTSYPDPGVLYMANFAPARLAGGRVDDALVAYSTADGDAYTLNRGLDRDKNGAITLGDLRAHLAGVAKDGAFAAHLAELAAAVPSAPPLVVGPGTAPGPKPAPPKPVRPASGTASALFAAGAVWAVYRVVTS